MYDLDSIHKEMLAGIPDKYLKTVGYPTYDITRGFAIGVKDLRDDVQYAVTQTNPENMTGDTLTKWVFQRKGIVRKAATYSTGKLLIVNGAGTIREGALFATAGGVMFKTTAAAMVVSGDYVDIRAVEAGASGNVAAETITLIPVTIPGIITVTNPEPTAEGYDEESDADLLERYIDAIQEPVTSGNKHQYRQWALEVTGVGDAKVYPLWAGNNTVKVVIIDSDHLPASDAVVAACQEYIDPGSTGTGEGTAPIGAYCTVVSAGAVEISVTVSVTPETGYTLDEVTENVRAGIVQYLYDIAFETDYVSYARMGNAIIDCEGVYDYQLLTINYKTANVDIADGSVAVLSYLEVTETT